jgi:hypothetical protein
VSTQPTTSTSWKPQPGDTVTGVIEDISEHDAGYGKYPILELATETGTVAVHAFHDVLKNELARLAPNIGDSITLTYKGKHPEKGYHQYRVRDGDGKGRGINWGAYGETSIPEPPASDVPSNFDGYGQPPQDKPKQDTGDEFIPF